MITIDNNFRIETDGYGCSLIQTEDKTRINAKTNETESYTVTTPYHFLTVEQCLNRYLQLQQEPCKTVLEVLQAIKDAKLTITQVSHQLVSA